MSNESETQTSSEQIAETPASEALTSETETTQESTTTEEATPSLAEAGSTTEAATAEDETQVEETTEATIEDPMSADSFDLPEDFDTEQPAFGEFLNIVNDPKLSRQEIAQASVDLFVKEFERVGQEMTNQWLQLNSDWMDQTVEKFGEQNLDTNLLPKLGALIEQFNIDMKAQASVNNTGMDVPEFGKEFREAMTLTGAGNHPAILEFLFWTADQLSGGAPLAGAPASGEEQSRAQKLFGTN